MNIEMNLCVPYNMEDFLTSMKKLVSRGLCYMELTAASYRSYLSPTVLLHTTKWKVLGSRIYMSVSVCSVRCAVSLWVQ